MVFSYFIQIQVLYLMKSERILQDVHDNLIYRFLANGEQFGGPVTARCRFRMKIGLSGIPDCRN